MEHHSNVKMLYQPTSYFPSAIDGKFKFANTIVDKTF